MKAGGNTGRADALLRCRRVALTRFTLRPPRGGSRVTGCVSSGPQPPHHQAARCVGRSSARSRIQFSISLKSHPWCAPPGTRGTRRGNCPARSIFHRWHRLRPVIFRHCSSRTMRGGVSIVFARVICGSPCIERDREKHTLRLLKSNNFIRQFSLFYYV